MELKITILLLFLISLVPENIGFNFEFELRALVFAVFATGMTVRIGVMEWWSNGALGKSKFKFVSIDLVYISCALLTVFSFVTKAQSINAFHFVFVAVGMFVVYSIIRFTNSDEILLQSKIIYSVIGIGFIVAVIGLIQFAMGKPIVSTFGRTSYLGCFLAMNVPIAFGMLLATRQKTKNSIRCSAPACAGRYRVFGNRFLFLSSLTAFSVILGVTVLTKSRSAMIALAIVLPIMLIKWKGGKVITPASAGQECEGKHPSKSHLKGRFIVRALIFGLLLLALGSAAYCGKFLYELKPMSASGRVLIWKVSAEMFRKNPVSGVGFGNFANSYNWYQANYFVSGKGTIVNKMTAGQIRHAYNWYLETAAEFGAFGLLVFGIFWWLILVEVYKAFFSQNRDHGLRTTDYVTLGMAGAVLCFMIMSLFQFPRKIIPTYLMFNVALAWIVNANLEENSKAQMINNKQIPKEEN